MSEAPTMRSQKGPSQPNDDSTAPLALAARSEVSAATTDVSAAHTASSLSPTNLRRRRGAGVVTPIACTECRRKRAKCDGQRPCGRCKSQNHAQCCYITSSRQSKGDLRTELENLREQQHAVDQVLAAVAGQNSSREVLLHLRSGQSI
jgi:hypothetical protein